MIDAFRISFDLKNTYKVNSIIYSLKSIPIIKRLLPEALYANRGLKIFANVLSILREIATIFTWKIVYIFAMIFLASSVMESSRADSFVHIFFFLTLIGTALNTNMFSPTKDKYYAMFLMGMDAKKYTLSNYYYFLIKTIIGLYTVIVIFGVLAKVNIGICLLMPLFVVSAKVIVAAFILRDSLKKEKAGNEILQSSIMVGGIIVLLVCAYVPPYFGYAMNNEIFLILCMLSFVGGVIAFRYMARFDQYRVVYKNILTVDSITATDVQKTAKVRQGAYLKKLDNATLTSKKSGYAYFNELFMKRHSRLLTKSAKKLTLVAIAAFVGIIVWCMLVQDIKTEVNGLMLTYLPYFLFIMYMINRGKVITEAMFMNCDHSMLSYRFYRQPKVILSLFAARLKSVVLINLMPASIIACGLPLLLFLTGGTDNPLNYMLLFISIIAMSIFFSVHNMVLYYLLQPYNQDMQLKNATYSLISTVTYIVCYFAIGKKVSTLLFGTLITAFCLLYVIIALVLAYRLAPKTFKLRQ